MAVLCVSSARKLVVDFLIESLSMSLVLIMALSVCLLLPACRRACLV